MSPRTLSSRRLPILCLVTDRRRWASDAGIAVTPDDVVGRVRAAARAGLDIVQIRERDLDARDLLALVAASVEAVHGTETLVVVNERTDVALAAGSHGVHLRADSLPSGQVRRLVPEGFVIGRSVHGAGEAGADATLCADYLVAGTVYPSRSKAGGPAVLGLEGLSEVVKASRLPVLAIGGISMRHVADIARTGAAGIAAIDLFAAGDSADRLAILVENVRRAFRQAGPPPEAPWRS